jgi:hypothetical protein
MWIAMLIIAIRREIERGGAASPGSIMEANYYLRSRVYAPVQARL